MTHQPGLDTDAIRRRLSAALRTATPSALRATLADIPPLLAEVTRLRAVARKARIELANLLAAARATIGAHHDGEDDPLTYLRDEISHHETKADPR